MEKIKQKFEAMKENIEIAEDRETNANSKLKETTERIATAEENAASFKRRIALLNNEYKQVQEKIDNVTEKLTGLGDKIQQDQGVGKDLEGMELDNDEQLNDLEFKAKEATARMEEKVSIYNDICRKLTKAEYDLSRAQDRCEKAECKCQEIELNLKSATESMVKLEKKDGEAGEREAEQEEQISFLEKLLKEKTEKCEEVEQEGRKLERTLDDITTDIEHWKARKAGVDSEKQEIEDIVTGEL